MESVGWAMIGMVKKMKVSKKSGFIILNLIPPPPFSNLEKGEKIEFFCVKSPLSKMERGFRGEVIRFIKK